MTKSERRAYERRRKEERYLNYDSKKHEEERKRDGILSSCVYIGQEELAKGWLENNIVSIEDKIKFLDKKIKEYRGDDVPFLNDYLSLHEEGCLMPPFCQCIVSEKENYYFCSVSDIIVPIESSIINSKGKFLGQKYDIFIKNTSYSWRDHHSNATHTFKELKRKDSLYLKFFLDNDIYNMDENIRSDTRMARYDKLDGGSYYKAGDGHYFYEDSSDDYDFVRNSLECKMKNTINDSIFPCCSGYAYKNVFNAWHIVKKLDVSRYDEDGYCFKSDSNEYQSNEPFTHQTQYVMEIGVYPWISKNKIPLKHIELFDLCSNATVLWYKELSTVRYDNIIQVYFKTKKCNLILLHIQRILRYVYAYTGSTILENQWNDEINELKKQITILKNDITKINDDKDVRLNKKVRKEKIREINSRIEDLEYNMNQKIADIGTLKKCLADISISKDRKYLDNVLKKTSLA